jgi:adenylosuccinate synthase
MKNVVVVGTQWGDEGKGKLVDLLAPAFDIVARYQGGHNAGHTVWLRDQKFVLHLVPSGILHEHCVCVIGNGVVVDAVALMREIRSLEELGVKVRNRLLLSSRAHLIVPYHREIERLSEERRAGDMVGTTMRGIGPTYEEKMGRRGIRTGDTLFPTLFRRRLEANLHEASRLVGTELKWGESYEEYVEAAASLAPFITDTARYLAEAVADGKSVLLEGAQATMLDIDHGSYPFVTSSSSTAGGACIGTGLPPTSVTGVVGIAKAYATRVGAGPFPTELNGETGELLRQRGVEYGASTGRPRRTGWFDVPVVRYAAMLNGLNTMALTKLDVLDELEEIRVCVAYRLHGETVQHMPDSVHQFAEVEPVYETFRGWSVSTRGVTAFENLPARAREYVEALAELTGVEIGLVSTGPARHEAVLIEGGAIAAWARRGPLEKTS